MINKPYYRIFRPHGGVKQGFEQMSYLEDTRYCKNKKQLVRVYKMLEIEVVDFFKYVEPHHDNEKVFSLHLY